MSDMLDLESPELGTAAYLRSLAAEMDGIEMLPGPRGNRLRNIADMIDAWDSPGVVVVPAPKLGIVEAEEAKAATLADLHAGTFGGG